MEKIRTMLLLAGGLGLLTISGCAAHGGYYANTPPPPGYYGAVGYAPSPGYVWTDGYYSYGGGRYVWVQGRWMRPPHPHAAWVAPRWERRGRGYAFVKGYWR